MRLPSAFLDVALPTTVLTCAIIASAHEALGATIRVPADAPTVQAALNLAGAGDTVLLSPGVYVVSNLRLPIAGITLRGNSPEDTILDGGRVFESEGWGVSQQGRRSGNRIISIDQRVEPTLFESLTFRNGYAGLVDGRGGGAVAFTFAGSGDLTFVNCRFENNSAVFDGGAIALGELTNATLGVYRCEFIRNNSNNNGGAISSRSVGFNAVVVVSSLFVGNESSIDGGALFTIRGPLRIEQSTFAGNVALLGPAISSSGLGTPGTDMVMRGTALLDAPASWPWVRVGGESTLTLTNSAIVAGVGTLSVPTIVGTPSFTGPGPFVTRIPSPGADGKWGTYRQRELQALAGLPDPRIDDDLGDLVPFAESPFIDAGVALALPAPSGSVVPVPAWIDRDVIGTPRRNINDLGAFEARCVNANADADGSGGTPDTQDIAAFFELWLLGDAPADFNCSGGTPDTQDIEDFFQCWLNGC
jgi:predicted outer membrane repeat protein